MKPSTKRLLLIGGLLKIVGLIATLVFIALDNNVAYFHTPTELADAPTKARLAGRHFRLGGLVAAGSITPPDNTMTRSFIITDRQTAMTVRYRGLLPDLFREGQGVVAEGTLAGDVFLADRLLAKHDENYVPPPLQKLVSPLP